MCGNSLVEPPEECDDRNQDSNDGCSQGCEIEQGWDCKNSPSKCEPVCGDGMVVGSE